MNLLNPGLRYLSIYDEVNDDFIRLKGNDVSPSSTLESEILTRGISSRGGVIQLNKKWELDLQFADKEVYEKMVGWPKTSTYRLFAYKMKGFIIWREPVNIRVDQVTQFDPESEEYPYSVKMTFIGPNPEIKEAVNAVAPWNGIEADPAWSYSGVDTLSFENGIQTVTTLGTGDAYVRYELWLGGRNQGEGNVELYRSAAFALMIDSMPDSENYANFRRWSNLYDVDGELLGAFNAGDITGTGFLSYIIKNTGFQPAVYRVEIVVSNLSAPVTFSFSQPRMFQSLDLLTEDDSFINY